MKKPEGLSKSEELKRKDRAERVSPFHRLGVAETLKSILASMFFPAGLAFQYLKL